MRAIFVHSSVDDAGLSLGAFRVLAHLSRRAGRARSCYPSIAGMAEVCRMRKTAVIEAVKVLEREGWVEVKRVHGRGSVYRLKSPASGLLQNGADRSPDATGPSGRLVSDSDRSERDTGRIGRTHRSPKRTKLVGLGDSKDLQEGNPRRISNTRASRAVCDSIYAAYPRKVGKLAALRAIEKAIRGGADPAVLLERVKAFAVASCGTELRFVPHPATWFNQGRWEDAEVAPEVSGVKPDPQSDGRVVAEELGPVEPPVETGADAAHLAWLARMRDHGPRTTGPQAEPFATETVVAGVAGRVVVA